ncbi:MAG: hypothetical protein EOO53_06650 [Gammaproteobacteria bacterium]|nr:MAG: hypothetical protein EOO53_06650 [Gammaproteobacteria bacterium]
MNRIELSSKAKAAVIHFGFSGLVGALSAGLVFSLWYPDAYGEIAGGWFLFGIVVGVDICIGPLLTFVVFDLQKPRKKLFRDLTIIVVIQISAFIYGMYVIVLARPVFLVFEIDRFRVVAAVEIDHADLPKAKEGLQSLGFNGPKIIAARTPKAGDSDYLHTMDLALQGLEISQRPEYWISYNEKRGEVLARAQLISDLTKKSPDKVEIINSSIKKTKLKESDLKFLPLQGRNTSDWIVLLNASNADVVGFSHVDGFIE